MNILIADSGSTSTNWVLIEAEGHKLDQAKSRQVLKSTNRNKSFFKTGGLNPYYLSEDELIDLISHQLKQQIMDVKVDEIHFYGAGCGRDNPKKTMEKAISSCFKEAAIYVESDLLGAARACFGNNEGVVCILGTGSNSCLYDGVKIIKSVPSLGFVLGDEGSGGYFGKKILNSYFYGQMPEDLRLEMEKKYDLNLETILQQVYKKPQANRFVASFTQLLFDFKDHPFCRNLLHEGFEDFAEKQLHYFGDLSGLKIGFVGSIATHKEILKDMLNKRGLELHVVIQKPIEKLVEFHLE